MTILMSGMNGASDVLEDCGYCVLTAPDGATALLMLRSRTPIDVLFTDIPVHARASTGSKAWPARLAGPRPQHLFASGYAGGRAPVSPLLKKPYRAHQLAGEIAAVLSE